MVEIKLLIYILVFIDIFMNEINSFNFLHSNFQSLLWLLILSPQNYNLYNLDKKENGIVISWV